MKANPDECQVTNSKCEKLLGIKIDYKLTFDAHIDEICKKAGHKMNALSGVIPYINITNRRSLLNTFFISQFNYCPLTWMCHSRAQNNKKTVFMKDALA